MERGLIHPDKHLTDIEAFNFIFKSRFSTASKVTNISGRDICLDVVRRQIEKFNGSVSIFSAEGKGTKFIEETLEAFKSFCLTDLNINRVKERFKEWRKLRKSKNLKLQLESVKDADDLLKSFYSPYSGTLWGNDYRENIYKTIEKNRRA